MGIVSIKTVGFRNLADAELFINAPEVFLVGENGQGKTNVLEALYLLCYGSSFRTRKDEQLRRVDSDLMSVAGHIETQAGSCTTVIVRLDHDRKSIERDRKPIRDRKELLEVMPCIVFCHDDISFVTGAPEMQRTFFDQTLSMYQPNYIDLLRRYRRILKMRNSALKLQQRRLVDVYDEQIVEAGVDLQTRRARLIEEFNVTFSQVFRMVSGLPEDLSVNYLPSWKLSTKPGAHSTKQHMRREATDEYAQPAGTPQSERANRVETARMLLSERRERDFAFGTSTSGPHRDRFEYRYAGKDFTEIASTGQVRLISLILRTAQAEFFALKTGLKPVLLLDDVLLELDPQRRKRFLSRLPHYEQAIFTFLPDEPFSRYAKSDTLIYRVHAGSFRIES